MSLTAKDVAEISRLLEDSSFTELNLELDGLKLTLRRGTPGAESPVASRAADAVADHLPAPPAPRTPRAGAPGSSGTDAPASDLMHLVKAPLLGTFYRAPRPGSPPFVEVGTVVEAQTIIGIIEVMKLMNTVRAGVQGSVSEILGVDGELVEFGQVLLRIEKSV